MNDDPKRRICLVRHPANPILTAKDWPYSMNSVFNPGATLLADGSTLLLCRVEDRRGLSHLCAARSANGVDGWQIDANRRSCPTPSGTPRRCGASKIRASPTCRNSSSIAVAYTSYSRGGPGVSLALTQDFRAYRKTWRHHAARRQRRSSSAQENQRTMGFDSSADDASGRSCLDFILAGPAALGRSQAYAGSSTRRVVGRQQDWHVASADRNASGMADALSRRPKDAIQLHLSAWPGPL